MKKLWFISLFSLACLSLILTTPVAWAADNYPKRSIKLVVPYSPGGGFDTQARGIAPFIEKYLPGDVKVVVENMPGAGGLTATSHMWITKPDGYKMGQFPVATAMVEQYLHPDEIRFKMSEFVWVGQYQKDIRAVGVRPDLPIKNWADLVKYGKKQSILFGTPGVGSPPYKEGQLISKVTGLPIDFVNYPGSKDAQAGIARKEFEAINLNFNSLLRWGDDVRILFVWADERHEMIPDIPTALEAGVPKDAYEKIMGLPIMGTPRAFGLPPGTLSEVAEVLREAFMKAMQDIDYKAWTKKAKQVYGPILSGDETHQSIQKMNMAIQENLDLVKSLNQ